MKPMVSITIPTGHNLTLKGWILHDERFPGKRPVVLVIHGIGSSSKRFPERVKSLVEMGYVCVLFDMRGHGQTGGQLEVLTIQDHLTDVLAAYDFLKTIPNLDLDEISVLASSYGAYLACLVTAQRTVKNMVFLSPAQYADEMMENPQLLHDRERYMSYRNQPHSATDNTALKALTRFDGELLIVQAELDEDIPNQVIEDYLTAAGENVTREIISGADHSYYNLDTNQRMIALVSDWFRELRDERLVQYFHTNYPGKATVEQPIFFPTEFLCEIEPTTDHPEYSRALAIINSSKPHYHLKSVEAYKVLAGTLTVYLDGTKKVLQEGEQLTIEPKTVHYAEGHETLIEVMSQPGWTIEDHILV